MIIKVEPLTGISRTQEGRAQLKPTEDVVTFLDLLAVVTFSQKGRGEREWEGWHLGGGCGLPKAGEERLCPLHPQAQLDVPSCLPQIPKRRKKFVGEQKIVWEFWREFSNSHKKTNWGEQMTNWGGQISNWGRADFKQRKSRRRSEEEQISNW